MAVLAVSAALFSMFTVGIDIILPLWTTHDLQLTAGQWAQLRALRFFGVVGGVIVLGALSDRFGQRLLGALSMLGTVVLLVWLRFSAASIWVIMPILGALVSTSFVNFNTLIQQVSARRQGVANSIYRGIGAATVIVAPVIATRLGAAWGGYPPVFLVFAVILVVAALVLFLYPGEEVPPSLGNLRAEVERLWSGYITACRQRPLMIFILLSLLWGNLLAGVGAFIAIRLTRELGQSDEWFGTVSAIGGAAALCATIVVGIVLDRLSLRKLHGVVGCLCGLCSVLMGVSDSAWLTAVAVILFSAVSTLLFGPSSMWVSRAAGEGTQVAAFSVHKILSALTVAFAMAALGWLEHLVGIRAIFLFGGLASLLTALGFFLLAEPPQMR